MSVPCDGHVTPLYSVLRGQSFLSHRPIPCRAILDCAADVDSPTSKSIIDRVHRRHQFAALPYSRRIEVNLAVCSWASNRVQGVFVSIVEVLN